MYPRSTNELLSCFISLTNKFVLTSLGDAHFRRTNTLDEVWLSPCSLLTSEHACLDSTNRWLCLLAVSLLVVRRSLCCLASAGAKADRYLCVRAVQRQQTVVGAYRWVCLTHRLNTADYKVTILTIPDTPSCCFIFQGVQKVPALPCYFVLFTHYQEYLLKIKIVSFIQPFCPVALGPRHDLYFM